MSQSESIVHVLFDLYQLVDVGFKQREVCS